MTLTELTTALHRWADKHGGKFPDALLCNVDQQLIWMHTLKDEFNIDLYDKVGTPIDLKGVRIFPILTFNDPRILFASSPLD